MNPIFQQQARLIQEIETYLSKLDDRTVSQVLNKEFFYHASNELHNHIPTEHASSQLLSRKILQQLAPRPDYDQIIDQIEHRLRVLRDDKFDQLQEMRSKFAKDKQKMRACGAKVKDYMEIYDQELKEVAIPNNITKKAISYFEANNRDWALEEMLTDLIDSLQPEESPSEPQSQEGEVFDEQAKAEMDGVLEQLRLMDSCFNFSS